MMRLARCFSISLPVLLLAACTVGPNYQRPKTDVPGGYRGVPATAPGAASSESLGDAKWWTVFQDEQLQSLIRTALKQNYDVRIAAERVLAAQAQLRIARSDQYPSAGVGVGGTTEREPTSPFSPAYRWDYMQVGGSASWDIDFWGKYRRATEAARANLAQTEWGKRAVVSTLVANVASAYFQLRALDLELEITQRTLASRQESLRLTKLLADQGAASMVDVRQAEQLVYVASATLPDLQRQIEQEENYLSFLLAQNPGPITRGRSLTEQARPPVVPAGLPSQLLERRPDIHEAEQQLIAANAQIGVARAAYFPSISLTGTAGFMSSALDRPVHEACRHLGCRRFRRPAALHRRQVAGQCPAGGSTTATSLAGVPADDPECVPRCFRRFGGIPKDSRDAGTARTAGRRRAGLRPAGARALRRWLDRLPRSPDQRNQLPGRRAGSFPGEAE